MSEEEPVVAMLRGTAMEVDWSQVEDDVVDASAALLSGKAWSKGGWTVSVEMARMTAEAASIWFGLSLLDASLLVDVHLVRGEN